MKAEDYLSAGRCPNCRQRLNVFGTYHHCYTCNSTWEHYQSMYGGTMTWGKVTGWSPPTEKEHFDHFEHYTSYSKFKRAVMEIIPIILSCKRRE